MSPVPDGRLVHLADRLVLHVDRSFDAPIEDVWAAITEPNRLARWLGTWRGDPTEGHVMWRMGFEEGADEHELEITSAVHLTAWPSRRTWGSRRGTWRRTCPRAGA